MSDMGKLEVLADRYTAVKDQLTALEAERLYLLGQIDARMSGSAEGTTTETDGRAIVTLTRKINLAVDTQGVRRLGNQVDVDTFFKPSYELIIKPYREATPEQLQILSQVITSKPGRPAVTIKWSEAPA